MSLPYPEDRPQVLALLAEIKDHLDDDAPRLVLADWLRDHDDPRGDFLAVQCRLAALPGDDPQRPALEHQERRLLKQHRADWLGPLAAPGRHWEFRRGLAWLTSAAEVLDAVLARGLPGPEAWAWVEGLRVEGRSWWDRETLSRLGQATFLPCLAALELKAMPVNLDTLDQFADAGLLAGLSRLRLEEAPVSLFEIGNSFALSRQLRRLELSGCYLRHTEMRDLVSTVGLDRLTGLDLAGHQFGPRAIETLTTWSRLAQLNHLELGRNRCHDEGAALLAACPHLARLTHLGLGSNSLGDEAVQALTASPHLGRLTSLDLSGNDISDASLLALARSPRLANLAALNIADNPTSSDLHAELCQQLGARLRA
jgi:uncharacterized protein (TIGR02996 family)